jgi:hypothetical protein
VQFSITVLLTISTICHTLGIAVSPVMTNIVLVFVYHFLYSLVTVMSIGLYCLSQSSLFSCNLQSTPNYFAADYPVGMLSI